MKKIRIPLLFVAAAAIMLVLFTDSNSFRYRYQVGSPWNYETLNATFDFPVLKSDAQLQQEREQKSEQQMDCYRYDDNVASQVVKAFAAIGADSLLMVAGDALYGIYNRGVVSSLNGAGGMISVRRGKKIEQVPSSDVYTTGDALEVRSSPQPVLRRRLSPTCILTPRPPPHWRVRRMKTYHPPPGWSMPGRRL